MKNQDIFIKARELANKLPESYIQDDLHILDTFLKYTGSETLIQNLYKTGSVYEFELSDGFIPFILYIKEKYVEECKCLSVFNKVIDSIYDLDLKEPESLILSNMAAYIFHEKFQEFKDIKIPFFFNFDNVN